MNDSIKACLAAACLALPLLAQGAETLTDVDEELEGGLNVRHAGPGLSGVRVSDALRRAQPASTALMVFSRVSSSTGLVR